MNDSLPLLVDRIETPVGELALVADEQGRLQALGFCTRHLRMEQVLGRRPSKQRYALVPATNPSGLSAAIRRYFQGDLTAIDDLPVVLNGTEFQRRVWRALRKIPCGETRSYGDIAKDIGNPAAVRAVGLANGANPVGIVVPCHRVIGADGTLTGYAGGIERKRWLLAHERRLGVTLELPLAAAQ
jgi:methylated-DNA-[protein]-cysteine S-methyltransferase